jgi:Ca-activated chloride channel homolog
MFKAIRAMRAMTAMTAMNAMTAMTAMNAMTAMRAMRTMRAMRVLSNLVFILFMSACLLSACSSTTTTGGTAPGTSGTTAGTAPVDDQGNVENQQQASDQELAASGAASCQRNFYVIFDGSGSMRHPPAHASDSADKNFSSKAEGAKWAVHEFMAKVPDDVNLGLFVFDRNGARQVLPLAAGNREKFLSAVDEVQPRNDTPLGRAIARGVTELSAQYKKQLGYGEFRLIVLTDGEATDNLTAGVNAAARNKIPIYTIGFDMGETHALRKHSVSYRAADSAAEVEKALEAAGAELEVYEPSAFRSSAQ